MRRRIAVPAALLFTLSLITSCTAPRAGSAPLTEADQAAIRTVFSNVVAHLRARDWDAFLATFDDDVVFHPANNPPLHGKEELRTWIAAARPATPEFDFTNVQISGAGGLAWATSDIAMRLEAVPPDQAKQLVVLRRNDAGEWKTVAVSFNSNTPLPADSTGG